MPYPLSVLVSVLASSELRVAALALLCGVILLVEAGALLVGHAGAQARARRRWPALGIAALVAAACGGILAWQAYLAAGHTILPGCAGLPRQFCAIAAERLNRATRFWELCWLLGSATAALVTAGLLSRRAGHAPASL